jgi:hypothetical protein
MLSTKSICQPFRFIISELKHVGRQRDDDSQNKFLQINDRINVVCYNSYEFNTVLEI